MSAEADDYRDRAPAEFDVEDDDGSVLLADFSEVDPGEFERCDDRKDNDAMPPEREPEPDAQRWNDDPALPKMSKFWKSSQWEDWASASGLDADERLRRVRIANRARGYGEAHTSEPRDCSAARGTRSTGLSEVDEEAFWTSRPMLTALRDFARDELASPWAVLGAVLALASAHVAPNVVLPPRRGNGMTGAVGSLNIFSVLAGPPGSNKSVAVSVASAFLDVGGGVTVRRAGPGSGEGIVAAFGSEDAQVLGGFRYRTMSVLLHADEVTGLDAQMRRTSSTLLPFLRTAWSGGDLSTLNAEAGRQRFVPEHAYRLAMTIGVQPGNAGVLLADADGGLPQRMLWFSAVDPTVGTHPDSGTGRWSWTVPIAPPILVPDPSAPISRSGTAPMLPTLRPRQQITMPQEAFDAYRAAAVSAGRGQGVALDGHAAQARGRVTALLALLDGRTTATVDDWNLAGMVMTHSDATRAAMVAAVAAETARANEVRGQSEGVRAAVAEMTKDDTVARRAGAWALDRLQRAAADGADGMTWSELYRACSSTMRSGLENAMNALQAAGQVTGESFSYRGQDGIRYRAARGAR